MDEPDKDESSGVIDGDLACRGCGYNLRGMVWAKVRCPECGLKPASLTHEIKPGDVIKNLQCTRCGYDLKGLNLDAKCPQCEQNVRASLSETRKGMKVDSASLAGFLYGAALIPIWWMALVVWWFYLQFPDGAVLQIALGIFFVGMRVMDFWPIQKEGKPVVKWATAQCVAGAALTAGAVAAGEFWWIPAACAALFRHAYLAQLMYALRIYHRSERLWVVVVSSPVWLFAVAASVPLLGAAVPAWLAPTLTLTLGILIFALWALAATVLYLALWWHAINGYKRGWTRLTGDEAQADREVLIAATHEAHARGVWGWD